MTVVGVDRPPSVASAAEQLGVKPEDVDSAYGVVPVDPANNLYAVMVREDRLPPAGTDSGDYRGPFANPKTEPFARPKR